MRDFISPSDAADVMAMVETRRAGFRILCLIRLHRWTKWKKVRKGKVTSWDSHENKKVHTGTYIDYKRQCTCCGRVEGREVRW